MTSAFNVVWAGGCPPSCMQTLAAQLALVLQEHRSSDMYDVPLQERKRVGLFEKIQSELERGKTCVMKVSSYKMIV